MTMLYINEYNRSDKTKNLVIDLDDRSGKFLFDLLLDPISNSMAKQGDNEWGADYQLWWNIAESQSLNNLPSDIFMQAYGLIQKSDNQDLKPFMPEILQKMQADPRFKKVA